MRSAAVSPVLISYAASRNTTMTVLSRRVNSRTSHSMHKARMRRRSPITASAIAGTAGKSASACISIAQGRSRSRSNAESSAVSGMPAIVCSSPPSGRAAEIGATVNGNAPRKLMQPLTAKSRVNVDR